MKGNTDWEKGQKEFSSGKGQKKTAERIEGFTKEGKLHPGRAWGSHGRDSDKSQSGEGLQRAGRGWKGLGVVKRKVNCLKPLHGGVDGLRLPYYS